MKDISENLDNSGLPMGLRTSTITNKDIARAISEISAYYEECMNMAKRNSGQSAATNEQHERQPGDVQERFESELGAETSATENGINQSGEPFHPDLDTDGEVVSSPATDAANEPEKKTRKKPDRSNPPYYQIYSEKDGGKEVKLEGRTETAGKALKFIYLHAARVAGDARKLYVIRCKRLTDAELLD